MNSRLMMAVAAILAFGVSTFPVHAQDTKSEPEERADRSDRKTDNMSESATDAWITTKVKTDLLATEGVSGTAINVDTRNGVVTLRGSVKSQAEADKAVSVAKGIKGVTSVTSELKVSTVTDRDY